MGPSATRRTDRRACRRAPGHDRESQLHRLPQGRARPVATARHDSSRRRRRGSSLKLVRRAHPNRGTASICRSTRPGSTAGCCAAHEILEDGLRDSLSEDDDYGSNTDLASLSADVDRHARDAERARTADRAARTEDRPRGDRRADHTSTRRSIAAGGPDVARSLVRLPLRQRQALDEATGAALETLAPVSEIMQVSTPGS